LGGLRFTINGEIGSPGTKTLFQESHYHSCAGDITITGDRKAVTVMKTPTGVVMQDIDLTDINAMK
jgi:polysaccharide export outer membrane protein